MGEFHIVGGNKFDGKIDIQGSKNSSLPIIASLVLIGEEITLKNVPRISDTFKALTILKNLGASVKLTGNDVTVNAKGINSTVLEDDEIGQMRSSIIFLGALVARFGECVVNYPGGCEIGVRPIDLHLKGLRALGVDIREENGKIYAKTEKLVGAKVTLDFPSVGATQNIMLASVFAKGVTVIENCAREPEIVDLANFLNLQGAKITGAGCNNITIEGVDKLQAKSYSIQGDRIVAGSYLATCALVGGELNIDKIDTKTLKLILNKLRETGSEIIDYGDSVTIKSNNKILPLEKLVTLPYPYFPTDMQSQMMALLSLAKGTSVIIETIFESRNKNVMELLKMGANITTSNDGMTIIIKGVKELNGSTVIAKDLRGGYSLCMAGLVADGNTVVKDSQYIERGYEKLAETLSSVGQKIKHVN